MFIQQSCILEFDGASKGNPGLSGAGAVLRAEDGSVVCAVHEKKVVILFGYIFSCKNVTLYNNIVLL